MFCASSSNLADMVTMVNRIDFGGHGSKAKVTMGIIDKCGVRGDATLCVVIFTLVAYFVLMSLKKQEAQRATYRAPEYNVPPF